MAKHQESETALNLVHQLLQYDFSEASLKDQLGQVDQGFGVTLQMIEALAKTSDDSRLESLAELIKLAWRNYGT